MPNPKGGPRCEKDCPAAISDDPPTGPCRCWPIRSTAGRAGVGGVRVDRVGAAGVHAVRARPAGGAVVGAARAGGDRAARDRAHRLRWVAATGSTRWTRCCARACSVPCSGRPAPRAPPGSTRPRWAGCWGWTGPRRSRRSAARSGCSPPRVGPATGSPRWRAGMWPGRPEQAAVLYVDGHVRAYQGTRRIAKTHVPRLKFPAPATVETWVADAAGDPLLVVLAQPAASLAGELRRLIPELRAMIGDERRVLVGFDRGGWSPALFADLDAAGFDTLTWRKGATADIEQSTIHRAHPHRRARPHPHLGTGRHRGRVAPRRRATRRAKCSRCARSACSTPPEPARCTS